MIVQQFYKFLKALSLVLTVIISIHTLYTIVSYYINSNTYNEIREIVKMGHFSDQLYQELSLNSNFDDSYFIDENLDINSFNDLCVDSVYHPYLISKICESKKKSADYNKCIAQTSVELDNTRLYKYASWINLLIKKFKQFTTSRSIMITAQSITVKDIPQKVKDKINEQIQSLLNYDIDNLLNSTSTTWNASKHALINKSNNLLNSTKQYINNKSKEYETIDYNRLYRDLERATGLTGTLLDQFWDSLKIAFETINEYINDKADTVTDGVYDGLEEMAKIVIGAAGNTIITPFIMILHPETRLLAVKGFIFIVTGILISSIVFTGMMIYLIIYWLTDSRSTVNVDTNDLQDNETEVDTILLQYGYVRCSSDCYFILDKEDHRIQVLFGVTGKAILHLPPRRRLIYNIEDMVHDQDMNELDVENENVLMMLYKLNLLTRYDELSLDDLDLPEAVTWDMINNADDLLHLIDDDANDRHWEHLNILHPLFETLNKAYHDWAVSNIDYRMSENRTVRCTHKVVHYDYFTVADSDKVNMMLIFRELLQYLQFMRPTNLSAAKQLAVNFMFVKSNIYHCQETMRILDTTLHAYVATMSIPIFDQFISIKVFKHTENKLKIISRRRYKKFMHRALQSLGDTQQGLIFKLSIIWDCTKLCWYNLTQPISVFEKGDEVEFSRAMLD